MKTPKIAAIVTAAALILTGCGGGGEQPTNPDPQPSATSAPADKKQDGKVDAKDVAKKMEAAWKNLQFYKIELDYRDGTKDEYEVDRRDAKAPKFYSRSTLSNGEVTETIEIPGDGVYIKEGGTWYKSQAYAGTFDFSETFQDIAQDGNLILVGTEDRNGIKCQHYQNPDEITRSDFWVDDKFNIVEYDFGKDRGVFKLWDHNVPVEIKAPI